MALEMQRQDSNSLMSPSQVLHCYSQMAGESTPTGSIQNTRHMPAGSAPATPTHPTEPAALPDHHMSAEHQSLSQLAPLEVQQAAGQPQPVHLPAQAPLPGGPAPGMQAQQQQQQQQQNEQQSGLGTGTGASTLGPVGRSAFSQAWQHAVAASGQGNGGGGMHMAPVGLGGMTQADMNALGPPPAASGPMQPRPAAHLQQQPQQQLGTEGAGAMPFGSFLDQRTSNGNVRLSEEAAAAVAAAAAAASGAAVVALPPQQQGQLLASSGPVAPGYMGLQAKATPLTLATAALEPAGPEASPVSPGAAAAGVMPSANMALPGGMPVQPTGFHGTILSEVGGGGAVHRREPAVSHPSSGAGGSGPASPQWATLVQNTAGSRQQLVDSQAAPTTQQQQVQAGALQGSTLRPQLQGFAGMQPGAQPPAAAAQVQAPGPTITTTTTTSHPAPATAMQGTVFQASSSGPPLPTPAPLGSPATGPMATEQQLQEKQVTAQGLTPQQAQAQQALLQQQQQHALQLQQQRQQHAQQQQLMMGMLGGGWGTPGRPPMMAPGTYPNAFPGVSGPFGSPLPFSAGGGTPTGQLPSASTGMTGANGAGNHIPPPSPLSHSTLHLDAAAANAAGAQGRTPPHVMGMPAAAAPAAAAAAAAAKGTPTAAGPTATAAATPSRMQQPQQQQQQLPSPVQLPSSAPGSTTMAAGVPAAATMGYPMPYVSYPAAAANVPGLPAGAAGGEMQGGGGMMVMAPAAAAQAPPSAGTAATQPGQSPQQQQMGMMMMMPGTMPGTMPGAMPGTMAAAGAQPRGGLATHTSPRGSMAAGQQPPGMGSPAGATGYYPTMMAATAPPVFVPGRASLTGGSMQPASTFLQPPATGQPGGVGLVTGLDAPPSAGLWVDPHAVAAGVVEGEGVGESSGANAASTEREATATSGAAHRQPTLTPSDAGGGLAPGAASGGGSGTSSAHAEPLPAAAPFPTVAATATAAAATAAAPGTAPVVGRPAGEMVGTAAGLPQQAFGFTCPGGMSGYAALQPHMYAALPHAAYYTAQLPQQQQHMGGGPWGAPPGLPPVRPRPGFGFGTGASSGTPPSAVLGPSPQFFPQASPLAMHAMQQQQAQAQQLQPPQPQQLQLAQQQHRYLISTPEPSEEEEDAAAALQAMHYAGTSALAMGGVGGNSSSPVAPGSRKPRTPRHADQQGSAAVGAKAGTSVRKRSPPGGSAVWQMHAATQQQQDVPLASGVVPSRSGPTGGGVGQQGQALTTPVRPAHRTSRMAVGPSPLGPAGMGAGMGGGGSAGPGSPAGGDGGSAGGLTGLPSSEVDWLEVLTTTERFFKVCQHCGGGLRAGERPSNGGRDALATLLDLDQPREEGVCGNCRAERVAQGHRLLQVRRSTYHDVVKVSDLAGLHVDLTGVQVYSINNARVVFLKPRPVSKPPKGSTMPARCVMDGRQLMDAPSKYCSLRCKIECELHHIPPAMSNNPLDDTTPGAAAASPAGGVTAAGGSPPSKRQRTSQAGAGSASPARDRGQSGRGTPTAAVAADAAGLQRLSPQQQLQLHQLQQQAPVVPAAAGSPFAAPGMGPGRVAPPPIIPHYMPHGAPWAAMAGLGAAQAAAVGPEAGGEATPTSRVAQEAALRARNGAAAAPAGEEVEQQQHEGEEVGEVGETGEGVGSGGVPLTLQQRLGRKREREAAQGGAHMLYHGDHGVLETIETGTVPGATTEATDPGLQEAQAHVAPAETGPTSCRQQPHQPLCLDAAANVMHPHHHMLPGGGGGQDGAHVGPAATLPYPRGHSPRYSPMAHMDMGPGGGPLHVTFEGVVQQPGGPHTRSHTPSASGHTGHTSLMSGGGHQDGSDSRSTGSIKRKGLHPHRATLE